MKIKLVVVEGNPKGLEIPIKGSRFSIGRDKSCNLRPASELVSKTHCLIQVVGDTVKASDLGSTNGTFVNDVRVEAPVALKPGDTLRVGPLSFNVLIEELKPVALAAAGPSKGVPGSESESDPLEWLLGDSEGQISEPSSSSTIMDLAAFTTETVNTQKDNAEEQSASSSPKNGQSTLSKPSDSNPANVKSPVRDTREAATEILNKYLVRRRST